MKYPPISPNLYRQLLTIEPSIDGNFKFNYYPCKVTLSNGESIDRVYIQEASSYFKIWGIYPEDDPGKNYVSIKEVREIRESPCRLTPMLASKIYNAGESGMGYCIFTLVMRNGDRLPYVTGNAIDFPKLPPSYSYVDIIDVLPHVGKNRLQDKEHYWIELPYTTSAKYWWCLYSIEK